MGLFGPQGISDLALKVFLTLVTFFVSPGDFRSHSTGIFSLCNIFIPPRISGTLQVFLAFVTFFIPPEISDLTLRVFLAYVTFFYS